MRERGGDWQGVFEREVTGETTRPIALTPIVMRFSLAGV